MSDSIFNVINKIYNKAGFLEKYGGSLWLTIILIIVFFVAISYFNVMNNIQPIKADWLNQRCSPSVMPFAGIINKPDNQSAFEFTASNFQDCIYNILTDIINIFLAPLYYLVNVFVEIFNIISEALQAIRSFIDSIRNAVSGVASEIMGRSLNFLVPIQLILIKINNMFQQTQAVMTAGIFTLMGTYDTMIATVTGIIKIVTSLLLALASIIVVLLVIPFGLGLPFAIPLLLLFIVILVMSLLVWIIDMMILKKFVNPLPGIPSCFDGNTILNLENGERVKMKNVKVGMILENNNTVTSFMEMACLDNIYELNNIICTGEHSVKFNNEWIKVKNHPDSKLLHKNYEKVYCINTSNKTIKINNIIFGDYDELNKNEIDEIKFKCDKYLPKTFNLGDIHKYLDGGFEENTKLELFDGHSVKIKDINVNDVLKYGERVVGIVEIKADDLDIKTYTLVNNLQVTCGPNINICDLDLGMCSTLDMYGESKKVKKVYNLITDKKTFCIDSIKYYDYNSCIDKFLDLENISLIKALI
jgi:hypothetical protein|uniref:Hedgehog/Intein (Hint) domain-containing protein n=1 Tax=viral metagenome TaxID=1070528 RepID=A0A6C0CIG6_9ZZZZ